MTKFVLPMKVGILEPKKRSSLFTIIFILILLIILGAIGYGIYAIYRKIEGFCDCGMDLPNENTGIEID